MPTESSADPTTSTSPNGTINFPPAGPTRTRSQPLVPLADGLPPSSTRSPASPSPVSPSPVSSAHLASTSSRHRAHTVSVSFRPPGAPRRGSARATGTFPRDTTSSSATSGGLLSGLTKEFGTGSKSVSEDIDPSPSLPSPRVETPEDRRTGTASERRRRSSSGIDGKRRRSASSARRGVLDSIRQSLEGGRGDERAGTPASVEIEREDGGEPEELHDEVVGVLDVIDDEVATVNHLQNMSNGLIFPNLPGLWSRRPEVILPDQTDNVPSSSTAEEGKAGAGSRRSTRRHRGSTVSKLFPPSASGFRRIPEAPSSPTDPSTTTSKTGRPVHSSLTTDEDDNEEETRSGLTSELNQQMKRIEEEVKSDHLLDAHVKHVLISSSKRDKLRRFGKGLWTFLKTPMGAFTAIYGFLVAFWGAGIVLFLLGWIPTSSKYVQDLWVERCSQIENGLFTLTGIGLVPWRVIDTYRMAKIWHLRVETHKRRKAQGLPPIDDPDDLPDPKEAKDYVSVLSDKEQEELQYQQVKFSKSQTWYRPHATATHTAFPIKWALWNTILMDGNSFFQALLCGCMWGLNWHIRPPWTTGTLIPCSFLCGIGAAVLIWQGSKRTKKTISVEDKLRDALAIPMAVSGMKRDSDGQIVHVHSSPSESSEAGSPKMNGSTVPDEEGLNADTSSKERHGWFGKKSRPSSPATGTSAGGTPDENGTPMTLISPSSRVSTSTSPLARIGETGPERRATIALGDLPRGDDDPANTDEGQGRPRGITVAAPRITREEGGGDEVD